MESKPKEGGGSMTPAELAADALTLACLALDYEARGRMATAAVLMRAAELYQRLIAAGGVIA